jgi:hypothetical protein
MSRAEGQDGEYALDEYEGVFTMNDVNADVVPRTNAGESISLALLDGPAALGMNRPVVVGNGHGMPASHVGGMRRPRSFRYVGVNANAVRGGQGRRSDWGRRGAGQRRKARRRRRRQGHRRQWG